MQTARQFFSLFTILLLVLSLLPRAARAVDNGSSGDYFVYVGTNTDRNSKGIYVFRFNAATGKLTEIGLAAESVSPVFLAVHPNHRFLYSVNWVDEFGGRKTGAVSAFSIDHGTGKLTVLNQASAHGKGPAHLSLDNNGNYVMVANYGSGSVAVLPVHKDGRLGEASAVIPEAPSSADRGKQEVSHAHCIRTSPDNRFALVADLGLDEVLVYHFDQTRGTLTANDPPFQKTALGAGPRHFAFHPGGRFLYVINETNCTVSTLVWAAQHGTLRLKDTISTLPNGYKLTADDSTAEIEVHPSGKFIYGSNRGHDSIAVFAVDPEEGTLAPVERVSALGMTPTSFAMDPTGSFLIAANQDSDTLVVFRIDPKTGRLTSTGQKLQVHSPMTIEFVPVK